MQKIRKMAEASQCSCQPPDRKDTSDCWSQDADFLISINYLLKKSDSRLEPNVILSTFRFPASEIPLHQKQ